MNVEELYLCVGICLPDADEAYCIGCGRPWGAAAPATAPIGVPPGLTPEEDDEPGTAA